MRGKAACRDWVGWWATVAVVLASSSVSCDGTAPASEGAGDAEEAALAFDAGRAWADLRRQVAFGPRITGSDASAQTRAWLRTVLGEAGWRVKEQTFPVPGTRGTNLFAVRGTGATVLVGTHYDTRMHADRDPVTSSRRDPVPGANDGASGTAVLVELARSLETGAASGRVCLAFFDAEDNGEIGAWRWAMGSRHFVAHRDEIPACAEPAKVLIVDMVGDRDLRIYQERSGSDAIQAAVWDAAAALDLEQWIVPDVRHGVVDDHTPFLHEGVPAAVMIDFDYAAWHTTDDGVGAVTRTSLRRVGRTVELWLRRGAP